MKLIILTCFAISTAVRIPVVSLSDEGRLVAIPNEVNGDKSDKDVVNKERRKLTISSLPFSLTCVLHKNYILADPTSEEEAVMETFVTVALNSSGHLVSLYKPGGPVLAQTSTIQVDILFTCYALQYWDI